MRESTPLKLWIPPKTNLSFGDKLGKWIEETPYSLWCERNLATKARSSPLLAPDAINPKKPGSQGKIA